MKNVFRALILEDDYGVRELLHNILSRMCSCSEITCSTDISTALSNVITATKPYDLIISDIHLKGLNDKSGLEFIQNLVKVKGDEYRKKILVISSDYDEIGEASKLGVRCLTKPFEISEIHQAIVSILSVNNISSGIDGIVPHNDREKKPQTIFDA